MTLADMLEYIKWRGDIPFSQVPFTPVDNLILSTLVYIDFAGLVGDDLGHPVPLSAAAEAFFALPAHAQRIRVKADLALLRAAASAPRFRDMGLAFYRDIFIPEEETQFAAMAYLTGDGSAFLADQGGIRAPEGRLQHELPGFCPRPAGSSALYPGICRRMPHDAAPGRSF